MQTNEMIKSNIEQGLTTLGIEFGSTRIKAVLINTDHEPIAVGAYDWENSLIDGIWTYSEEEIWTGLQGCYKNLVEEVKAIIVDTLNCEEDKVTLEANIFDDLGADSLDAMELNLALEEKLGKTISDEQMSEIKTVGDIVKILEQDN